MKFKYAKYILNVILQHNKHFLKNIIRFVNFPVRIPDRDTNRSLCKQYILQEW